MPLTYYPSAGEILLCRYDDVVIDPEMRKPRPIVVVGPRLRSRARLVAVVPLSTTEPIRIEDFHFRLTLEHPLPQPFDNPTMWAKCDMVSSVSLSRLDRFKEPHRRGGGRQWRTGRVTAEQLRSVRAGLLCGLGFATLTNHL